MAHNCHLDSLTQDDLSALIELFTCPRARQYLGGPITKQLATQRSHDWIKRSSAEPIWAIRALLNQTLLGYVILDKHHDESDIEISYALLTTYWGRGLATQALTQASRLAFFELGLPRIIAETQAKNLKSTALLERIGMNEERRVFRFGEEQIIFSLHNPSPPMIEQVGASPLS
ncbi:GNAT family N-acetyltransferase [Luteolibacter pohnpeiensis]|nr:GNAT family N-acetyltransferase [Luteolibacter pohnpeiensis]